MTNDASQKNYYELLGVNRDATTDQIKDAYKDVARLYHPDSHFYDEIIKVEQSPEDMHHFKLLTAAYNVLVDPEKRSEYDKTLPPPLKGWDDKDGREVNPLRPSFTMMNEQPLKNLEVKESKAKPARQFGDPVSFETRKPQIKRMLSTASSIFSVDQIIRQKRKKAAVMTAIIIGGIGGAAAMILALKFFLHK